MKLNEISPEWAKSIELGHVVDPDLHIASSCCCVVGEAYGFRDMQYSCKECDTISMEYFAGIEQHYKAKLGMWKKGDLSFNREKVERITRKFEMHWSKEHAKLQCVVDNELMLKIGTPSKNGTSKPNDKT